MTSQRQRMGWALAACWVAACAAPSGEPAETWTARDFPTAGGKTFGAMPGALLGAAKGAVIPFRGPPYQRVPATQGEGFGLTIFPATRTGALAAFTVTELWSHHPLPWVQPVWVLVSSWHPEAPGDFRVPNRANPVPNIFPVDVSASFYSPFWKLRFVVVGDGTVTPDTFTSARDVLDANLPTYDGPNVLCPVMPPGFNLAHSSAGGVMHPFTGGVLLDSGKPLEKDLKDAWVDGAPIKYLDLGANRFTTWEGGNLEPTDLFGFASRTHPDQLLPIPFVLPDNAADHGLMSLYLVSLPAPARIFVPSGRPQLEAMLLDEGYPTLAADPNILDEVANRYLLRVAADPGCFTDAGAFPQGCRWLDSEQAVKAQGDWRLQDTETWLAVAAFAVDGGTP